MLRLTQKAREDLRLVYLEGLERFGARQADVHIDSLLDRLDLLSDFPGPGRERDELGTRVRSSAFRSHVIIYRLEGARVRVLRIRHRLEDWLDQPPEAEKDTP